MMPDLDLWRMEVRRTAAVALGMRSDGHFESVLVVVCGSGDGAVVFIAADRGDRVGEDDRAPTLAPK